MKDTVGIQTLILLGGHSILFFERLKKARVIPKAEFLISTCYAGATGYCVSALRKALFYYVLMKGNAKRILEKMRYIVLADKEFAGNIIKCKGILKIALNISNYVLEKSQLIAAATDILLIVDDSVDGKDKVAEAQMSESSTSVSLAGDLLKKAQELGLNHVELSRSKMINVLVKSLCLLDKEHIVHRLLQKRITTVLADPEKESSIVLLGIVHKGMMRDSGRNQHKVTRRHLVSKRLTLGTEYLHCDIALYEKVAFIIIMRMGFQSLEVSVRVVKDLKVR